MRASVGLLNRKYLVDKELKKYFGKFFNLNRHKFSHKIPLFLTFACPKMPIDGAQLTIGKSLSQAASNFHFHQTKYRS